MKLYFDTSDKQKTVVQLGEKKTVLKSGVGGSQQLLPLIDKMLRKIGKSVQDISEIEVNLGPGSFTGLKVGCSIGNCLGFLLEIPVNGRIILKDGLTEPLYQTSVYNKTNVHY
jgi:tRNA threonylcarbamoyladenosine biosynthesis protein TsaB